MSVKERLKQRFSDRIRLLIRDLLNAWQPLPAKLSTEFKIKDQSFLLYSLADHLQQLTRRFQKQSLQNISADLIESINQHPKDEVGLYKLIEHINQTMNKLSQFAQRKDDPYKKNTVFRFSKHIIYWTTDQPTDSIYLSEQLNLLGINTEKILGLSNLEQACLEREPTLIIISVDCILKDKGSFEPNKLSNYFQCPIIFLDAQKTQKNTGILAHSHSFDTLVLNNHEPLSLAYAICRFIKAAHNPIQTVLLVSDRHTLKHSVAHILDELALDILIVDTKQYQSNNNEYYADIQLLDVHWNKAISYFNKTVKDQTHSGTHLFLINDDCDDCTESDYPEYPTLTPVDLQKKIKTLTHLHRQRIDEYTGRACHIDTLKQQISSTTGNKKTGCLALFQLDQQLSIVQQYGEACLIHIKKTLSFYLDQRLRKTDTISTIDQEGCIAVYLNVSDFTLLERLIERIRSRFSRVRFQRWPLLRVSLSCGLTNYKGPSDFNRAFTMAQKNLEKAIKRNGDQIIYGWSIKKSPSSLNKEH